MMKKWMNMNEEWMNMHAFVHAWNGLCLLRASQEWAALEARNSRNRWSPPEDSAALVALEAAGYRDMHQSPSRNHQKPMA